MELVIDQVGKQYRGNNWGLQEFSLRMQPGVLGLLGPNGAGKSTLMNILATVSKPTKGKVTWNGIDIVKKPNLLRQVLGYLPQSFGVYENLNAVEFLQYMAAIKGLDSQSANRRIEELLQLVNLSEVRDRPLGGHSGGMKQRVGIAQALLNDPQLLIVDEPTVGLDPEERVRFRNLLSDLARDRLIILSTHIVSDIEAIATQIVMLKNGRIINKALPEELLQRLDGCVWEWTIPSNELNDLKEKLIISNTIRRSDGLLVRAVSQNKPDNDATLVSPNLEDAYLYHIGGGQ